MKTPSLPNLNLKDRLPDALPDLDMLGTRAAEVGAAATAPAQALAGSVEDALAEAAGQLQPGNDPVVHEFPDSNWTVRHLTTGAARRREQHRLNVEHMVDNDGREWYVLRDDKDTSRAAFNVFPADGVRQRRLGQIWGPAHSMVSLPVRKRILDWAVNEDDLIAFSWPAASYQRTAPATAR